LLRSVRADPFFEYRCQCMRFSRWSNDPLASTRVPELGGYNPAVRSAVCLHVLLPRSSTRSSRGSDAEPSSDQPMSPPSWAVDLSINIKPV
jgi:hypothetical protein